MAYKAVVGLKGLNGKIARVTYNLVAVNSVDALSALSNLVGALAAVSDATIAYQLLVNEVAESTAAGGGDIFEVATVSCLAESGTKVVTVNIPAPKIGIFLASSGALRDQVDVNDSDMLDYVSQLSAHVTVSDGDSIDDVSPLRGRRVTRKLSAPSL